MLQKIDFFEEATDSGKQFSEMGINSTLYWAYRNSLEAGCDFINFDEVIWEKDIVAIAESCRKLGIRRFTISSTFSSLITTLAAFEAQGCKMDGLTQVRSRYTDFCTGERSMLPAICLNV